MYYQIESELTYTFTSGESALFFSGGVASKCKISKGAAVSIGQYGAASGTSVCSGGTMSFLSGCFPGETNFVQSGGVLKIGDGAQAGNITAANGAILCLTMAGDWFRRPTDYVVTSNGAAIKKNGKTSVTSLGIEVTGFAGWDMKTSGCGLVITDWASAAFVKVSSGCGLTLGSAAPYGPGCAGTVDVYDGGSANLYKANNVGLATVHSGGVMYLDDLENVTLVENGGYMKVYDERIFEANEFYDPNVKIKPNTFKDLVLNEWTSATAHSGTVASHITLKNSAALEVYSGGLAANTVISGGWLKVFSGGVASDIAFETSKSYLDVLSGGKITGKLDFGNGSVIVADGGIIDFDISALKGNKDALLKNYNVMPVNVGDPRHTITVSGMTQTKGTYALATQAYSLREDSEYRSEQQKIFAICDTSGTKIGSVKIGTKTQVGDRTYALNLSGSGDLSLTVAAYVDGEEIWTDARPDADDGWNNNLFVSKRKYVLPEYAGKLNSTPVPSTGTTAVVMDKKLAITVNNRTYKNYAGEGDGADFAKITLDKSARLNFSVNATGSAKFTVWKLVPLDDGEFAVKAVKSVSAKKASKNAAEYTASTGQLLLESGVYYVSVEASAKKGRRAYYNVNIDQKEFYLKSDNSDDWGDVRENGSDGKVDKTTIKTLKAGTSKVLTGGWVGCGDAVDYMKFHLDTAAKLVFQVNAGDASSFAIYSLNGPKKGKHSLKSLLSSKLSKNSLYGEVGETAYRTVTKGLLLEEGDYYICMKSTNADKHGNADYDILLDSSSIFFDKIDDRKNNVLVDSKKKLVGVCETISLGLTSKAVQMDKVAVNYGKWKNFVGHNDDTDYAKIKLSQDLKASFTVEANDAAKFTLYKLVKNGEKYSLKAVQSKTLKKKDGVYAATLTRQLKKDDDYYLCMKSTNAKKGGNAYYNVTYEYVSQDMNALTAPEETDGWGVMENAAAADSVLADAFAADSFMDTLASDAVSADVLADSGFVTLSGADLADLRMSGACDPAVSPVPVAASKDLFAGLLA
jgi:autotransporter passenger strand-loop-strand repeat protein